MEQQSYRKARMEAEEKLQESLSKLAELFGEWVEEVQIAVQALLVGCSETWEDIKRLIEDVNEHFEKQEEERKKFKPPIKYNDFPLVTKVFKNQVMNNKPLFIRIRSNC
jgi:hypothetical protein